MGRDFGGKCRYFVVFTIRVSVKSEKADWVANSSDIASRGERAEAEAQEKQDPHESLVYQPVQVTDRAREFLGGSLERFLAEQGIHSTRTAPEDHAANGAAEVAIRELKRSARKALISSNLESRVMPLADGHSARRRGLLAQGHLASWRSFQTSPAIRHPC